VRGLQDCAPGSEQPQTPEPPQNVISPSEALDRLMQGNARYAAGECECQDYTVGRAAFRTHEDQSIHMVDLKQAVESAKGEVQTIEMEGTKQPMTDVSANTTILKAALR
jgi:hypothetical protein